MHENWRAGEREQARVLKASAPVVMMTLVGTFFTSCLRGVEEKNSIANEWALASGRRKKEATESGSHQFNKCCGNVFALLVNAFGAGVANLVQGFFGQELLWPLFTAGYTGGLDEPLENFHLSNGLIQPAEIRLFIWIGFNIIHS
jgi:hypothetical protein